MTVHAYTHKVKVGYEWIDLPQEPRKPRPYKPKPHKPRPEAKGRTPKVYERCERESKTVTLEEWSESQFVEIPKIEELIDKARTCDPDTLDQQQDKLEALAEAKNTALLELIEANPGKSKEELKVLSKPIIRGYWAASAPLSDYYGPNCLPGQPTHTRRH